MYSAEIGHCCRGRAQMLLDNEHAALTCMYDPILCALCYSPRRCFRARDFSPTTIMIQLYRETGPFPQALFPFPFPLALPLPFPFPLPLLPLILTPKTSWAA
jgi:hypothetical protein